MAETIFIGAQDYESLIKMEGVLEFKVRSAAEASLAETARHALAQMEEKRYDAELTARGILKGQIRHYGFAFEGKRVLIG